MEKLLNSIPTTKSHGIDKNGKEILSGIAIRYRADMQKWACGYGSKLTDKSCVIANDPIEALAEFVELLNKKTK